MSVVLAVATGIGLDRLAEVPNLGWIAAASLGAVIALLLRWRRVAGWPCPLLVLWLWVCIGGLRHHECHDLRRPDNITTYLSEHQQMARLVGRLESGPVIDKADHTAAAPRWTQVDRTLAYLRCESIGDSLRESPVSGCVRLEVTGHLVGPLAGDQLELFGVLQRPSGPRNPGGFDYAEWLRSQGADATFRVKHPDHVRVIASRPSWLDRLRRWRNELRRSAEWVCIQRLDYSDAPMATSLLLGDRSGLDPLVAEQFAASGTMHLLAISGLHVGILAGLVHLICRLAQLRTWSMTIVLLLTVVGYAVITDQRPPVLRAALLTTIVLSGRHWGREAAGYQSLALCALAILLYRPSDLFDAGAQLSFLAVVAIIWSGHWQRELRLAHDWSEPPSQPGPLGRVWSGLVRWLRPAYVLTGSIWLLTLPLTMWHFHLCSPVGLLVNVALIPVTALMLASGYVMVLLGLVHSTLAIPPAYLFTWLLDGLLAVVNWSAGTAWGHRFVPAPPGWWLAGFYALLAWAIHLLPIPGGSVQAWKAVGVWTVAGLALAFVPARTAGLRATFLSVGHGCAVLIETPNGATLLFDGGALVDGRRAEHAISAALWVQGHREINVACVSHADVDHFNGLPGLARTVPIGSILMSQSMLDFEQEAVVDLCESVSQQGVPIRLVQAGDCLEIDPDVTCEVLHPPVDFRAAADNANSLVLRLRYAGRTLLLTGDLEGAGLERLLRLETSPIDVLMSPHHGSRAANPSQLAGWARPRIVVASAADKDSLDHLRVSYPRDVQVFSTANSGAIEVTISTSGHLTPAVFVPSAADSSTDAIVSCLQ
ncbi:MAG: ComEC/Rec2 family competence protein [Planctomycetaceae bacterium]